MKLLLCLILSSCWTFSSARITKADAEQFLSKNPEGILDFINSNRNRAGLPYFIEDVAVNWLFSLKDGMTTVEQLQYLADPYPLPDISDTFSREVGYDFPEFETEYNTKEVTYSVK
jgi:hypothetical protein